MIYAERLEHEPLDGVTPSDIRVISGATDGGEILAYGTFKALGAGGGRLDATMRDKSRALFPVEEVFGRGLFDRVNTLPELPARRVREAGRLMKNHHRQALDELVARAPAEAMLAGFQFATSELNSEFDACIGDIELGVAPAGRTRCHCLS